MKRIPIFKVCPHISLFRDFLLIFMFPVFHICIDFKWYLPIPPLISMFIRHILVLRK